MIRAFLAVALLAIPLAVSAAEMAPATCDVPADLVVSSQALARAGRALQPGGRLDVLALGSGTLLGPRGGVEGSVPDHMLAALHAAAPAATVHLTLHGARAATAAEMLIALRKELAAHSYQLVLWQTGTVEAVRKLPPDQFAATLGEGSVAVAAAGADLVLIDVPYSRLLESNSDLAPYRAVMEHLAGHGDAALFRRYDLMRHWADSGELDLESAAKHDRNNTADRLRDCLGQALAKFVLKK
jgi:hypothetical protein